MDFSLTRLLQTLENTPAAIASLLHHIGEASAGQNEGAGTWSPKEVLAHLVLCEETNWLPRIKTILSGDTDRAFTPIDMQGHFTIAANSSLQELVTGFSTRRENSIHELKAMRLRESDLLKTAMHPKLGEVTLQQLIATWAAHDLTHTAQITRVLAKQYKDHIGPYILFLNRLQS